MKNTVTLGLRPTFSSMRMRIWWLRVGKNWEMLNAKVLVDLFLIHPDRIMYIRVTPTSIVDLNLRPPSWLG